MLAAALVALSGTISGQVNYAYAEPACLGATEAAVAAEIVDARALRLADGRLVRFAGIEPFDLLLLEAGDAEERLRARLAELVSRGALTLHIVANPDRYGRLPALVMVEGALLQAAVTREGLAIAFAGGDALPCFDQILKAEAEARRAGRALWADAHISAAFPTALRTRVGRFAIFEGTVVSVGTRRAASYLDFGRSWSTDVTIEIAAKDREAFGGEAALEGLAGARIRARGFLKEKGGPMLPVRSPMQIEILAPADRIAP